MATSKSVFRLNVETRKIILNYARKYSPLKISRLLDSKLGINTTRQSVWRFLKRFSESKIISDSRRKVKSQSRLTVFHIKVIDFWLCENNELTAHAIVNKLKQTFDKDISRSRVSSIRKKLRWTTGRSKYCQLITHVNKEKGFQHANKMLSVKEDFKNVVFVNESTVEMCSNGRLFFYKPDSDLSQLLAKKQKPKHFFKVHVWGGISYHGRTDICIFTGIMDSIIYQQILEHNFLPFVRQAYPDGYRLYQDNDSKHTSRSTKAWMQQIAMLENVMETPASSPDLNPIENVWAVMKQYLQDIVKPKKKDQLI